MFDHNRCPMSAEIVSSSIGKENGVRLISMEVIHPRVILAEVNTHRVMTKNGASSRAIPFPKMVRLLRENGFMPIQWLENQPGMVSDVVMSKPLADECDIIWREAMEDAIKHATRLHERRASKQYVNRLLEPFMMQKTLLSSTRWQNFFKLRNEKGAMPEFREIAAVMQDLYDHDDPVERSCKESCAGWHMTYIDGPDWDVARNYCDANAAPAISGHMLAPVNDPAMATLLAMASARAARTSYRTFEGEVPPIEADLNTFNKLRSDPLHASPFEHQAFPLPVPDFRPRYTGNFHGWFQLRKLMPNEAVEEAVIQ